MTIRREVDWLGFLISRSTPPTGVNEALIVDSNGGTLLMTHVIQPNTLRYGTGLFLSNDGDSLESNLTWTDLDQSNINRVDIASRRNLWGKRTRYRWYPSGVYKRNGSLLEIPDVFKRAFR